MRPAPRTVLVTGASSGIGRASALALAARGDNVVLVSRSAQALAAIDRECREAGGASLALPADVADREAVEAAFATAETVFGRVDAVVHSAATLAYGRFEDVPAEVFDAALATTLGGTTNVSRAALRAFRRHGSRGSLVVVGSVVGKIVAPYMSTYATAKWAVHGLVRTLQIEARSTPGIGITLVSPGGVDTPVYTQAGTYVGVHGRPPPPVDPPEKVARAVVTAIDHPRREVSVGRTNAFVLVGFRVLPGLYDVLVTPLMRRGGLSRRATEATPGNVLAPHPEGESLHGSWPRRWR